MDKAKQAVSNFVSGAGEHKTSVDRDSRAAVTEEHVLPQQHNKVTTAIDKEVHQDHHRTVVQPIKHTETLPEKHTHNIIPVEHKTFEHDSAHDARATLDRDAAKYKDSSVTHETKHTSSAAPVVTGEHVHHHIHEHIQPVIEKQTVAPETVHTTVPIHETHHHPTVHHGTTTMPATTMQEFEKQHGSLTGSQGVATVKEFDGCAHDYLKGGETKTATGTSGLGAKGDAMAAAKVANDRNEQSKMFSGDRTAATGTTGTAATGTAATGMTGAAGTTGASNYKTSSQTDPSMSTGTAVPRSTATDKTTTSTTTGTRTTAGTAAPVGTTATGRESVASGTSTASKPSLKDKLNPFKDADGDGKKGIMS